MAKQTTTRTHPKWTRYVIIVLLMLIPTIYYGGPPIRDQIWFHQHSFVWTPSPIQCGETVYSAKVRTVEEGTFLCDDYGGVVLTANGEEWKAILERTLEDYLFWGFYENLTCKGDWQKKNLLAPGYTELPATAFMACHGHDGLTLNASYIGP